MKVNASGNKWCRAYGAQHSWATRTQPLRAGLISDATPSLERTTVGRYKSKHQMAGVKVDVHTEEKSGPPEKAVATKAKTEAPTLKKNKEIRRDGSRGSRVAGVFTPTLKAVLARRLTLADMKDRRCMEEKSGSRSTVGALHK